MTDPRANRDSRYVGRIEASANGSSRTADDRRQQVDHGLGSEDLLVVVGAEALGDARARGPTRRSSASSKPIENVFTARTHLPAISATTALESIPPLRNAPSGTSLIRRTPHRVARAARGARSALVRRDARSRRRRRRTQVPVALDRRPRRPRQRSTCPAGSLLDAAKIVRGAGTYSSARYASTAPRGRARAGQPGCAQQRLELRGEEQRPAASSA